MPNFTPYLPHPQLKPFAAIAEAAEKILPIDPAASILNCRRGMDIFFFLKKNYLIKSLIK